MVRQCPQNLLADAAGICGAADVKAATELAADGRTMKLHVSGAIKGAGGYLGVSFYQFNARDALRDGEHVLVDLRAGDFMQTIEVPEKCIPGTFAAAVWSHKIEKRNCSIKDCVFCSGLGYHMETQLAGASGELARPVSGSLSAKVSVNETDDTLEVVFSGRLVGANAWLGVSFYRPDSADPAKGAKHYSILAKEGQFQHTIIPPDEFCRGSFEAALWTRKTLKENCAVEGCPYCSLLGYHMAGLVSTCPGKVAVGEYGQK